MSAAPENLPLVTIGIPCLNAAQWIQGAIESAIAQENVRVQVVVVDDGSTDGSLRIAEDFGNLITVVRGAGEDAPVARNRALALAQGGWIQFLDADDYLLPGKVSTQIREAAAFADGVVPYAPVLKEFWREGNPGEPVADFIDMSLTIESQWLLWQMPQTSGPLWPTHVLRELGGWKPGQPCCQEHELYLRAMRNGVQFGFTPSALAVYRLWSEETLCRKNPAKVIHVRAGLIAEMLDWLESEDRMLPEHRESARRVLFESARSLAVHDPEAAGVFHDTWKRRGLIEASGPAAPALYRMLYKCAGFDFAERVARMRR